jgi:isoquinoline 1-oxidoreductase beta subunit
MATTRREFIRNATLQGVVLVVTIPHLSCRATAKGESLATNRWIEIDEAGVVTLVLDKMEMGQGVSTALPMILAEELGADWAAVRVIQAKPGPTFTEMGTSGSGSVIDAWFNHRIAAAALRTMLVSAAATQWNVAATECHTEGGEVRHRGSNRRASFASLVAAARLLPVPEKPELKPASEYRLLGTRVPDPVRTDIVTGRLPYGIDMRVPGMLFATVARSPVHGGSVRRFSPDRVLAMAGVRHVVQVPSGVAVVATSTWEAMQGRAALEIEWDDGPNASFDDNASWRMLEEALRGPGKVARSSGDARQALSVATRRIEAEYRWPWQAHGAIEPLSAVAHVKDGGCEIWAGMQNPNGAQARVAEALSISPERVVVNPMRLGGGFGRRIASDYVVEAAHVSHAISGPVQVVWTRADDFQHDMYGAAQINRLAAALNSAGQITAWEHRVGDFHLSMFGSYNAGYDPAADGDPWGGFDSPYVVPDLRVDLALVESPIPSGAWRAVTYPAAVMARESFIDEIAHATGADPVALRVALIPSPGTITRGGLEINNGDRLRRCLALAAERGNWGRPLPPAEAGRRVGRGIACNSYHRGTMVAQVAEVSVGAGGDIRVHRIVSAVDGGQVINRAGVEKQFEGGIGWALSALFGPGVHFQGGRTVAASIADYPVLRMDQMPAIETHIVESSIRPFGMGEPPVPAVAPAVLNAVFAATGTRIRILPIQPQLLQKA